MKTVIITESQMERLFEAVESSSIVTFYRGVGGEFDLKDFGLGKEHRYIWLADSPEYAADYAAEYGDEGRLFAVDVDMSRYNPYDWYEMADSYFEPIDGFSSEETEALMSDGYNGYDFALDEGTVIVLFDPSLIIDVRELPLQDYLEESKQSLVTEAAKDTFSLNELNAIKSFYGRSRYCWEHIGLPIGQGSSRDVYQLDDEKVLKLARNEKGIAQNIEEGKDSCKAKNSVFPIVYDYSDDGIWLVSEYVLPATEEDFQEVFNMPFRRFIDFVAASSSLADSEVAKHFRCARSEDYSKFVNSNVNFASLDNYIRDYNPPPRDLMVLENYGLALRDGKPYIILLDSGFTYEIYQKYYKRK